MSFSPSSFLANFSVANQAMSYPRIGCRELTQFPLVNLFGSESKHTQQLDHNFDYHLGHGRGGSDLRVYFEPTQEVFDACEYVDEGIIA
jgi:hypothetical protein